MLFLSMYTFNIDLLTMRLYVHNVAAAQSERVGNKHANSRTAYRHVTFLHLYIDNMLL